MTYALAIENDWLYIWFDGVLCLRLDLVTWGQYDAGSTYNLDYYCNNNGGHISCEWLDIKYLTGTDAQTASAEMIAKADQIAATRANYGDINYRAYSLLENNTIGNVSSHASTGISTVYMTSAAAATAYLYETTITTGNFDGFAITGADKTMTFVTNQNETGFTLSMGWQLGGLAGLAAQNDSDASVSGAYGWGCMFNHGVKPETSALQWIGTGIQWGRSHKITVVISEGILYVLVDDNAYMTIPLS